MTTLKEKIGANVQAYREHLKLTQDDLAGFLNVKREVISYYESGTREMPLDKLKKVSELYGVDLLDLMEEDIMLSKANLAFAFRADGLSTDDLEVISGFKRVVKNYLKLTQLNSK